MGQNLMAFLILGVVGVFVVIALGMILVDAAISLYDWLTAFFNREDTDV